MKAPNQVRTFLRAVSAHPFLSSSGVKLTVQGCCNTVALKTNSFGGFFCASFSSVFPDYCFLLVKENTHTKNVRTDGNYSMNYGLFFIIIIYIYIYFFFTFSRNQTLTTQRLDNWLCSLYGLVTFGLCSLFTYGEGLFCLLHWIGASLLALLLV